ncbi:flavin-containing monooxygenase [Rhodococcus aerolatus]
MTATTSAPSETPTSGTSRHTGIVIVGSGFSGLGAAIRLTQEGITDFLVLERGHDVGGTWRDNTYPGAACDVPSQLYSFSFDLNPNWSRSFSTQPEIQAYLHATARKHGVVDKHVFDCEVESATWDAATSRWVFETSQGRFTADVAVSAVGALCEPSLPAIPGLSEFPGKVVHTARWDHDEDLTGKRVAVIGTGASAIQVVPAIAERTAHLDVYQRTAPWLLPRFDREYTRVERLAYKLVPGLQRLARTLIYGARETQVMGLAKNPRLMLPLRLAAKRHIHDQISDPELRAKVTPNFEIGCKRMLISNAWYPALARDDVDLVTDGIVEVRGNAIVASDGTEREVDVIVVATGFHVTDSPTFEGFHGAKGRSLADKWRETGMEAYKGLTVDEFPNMFFLVGPNTGLGHTSMVYMIESQINYLVDAVKTMRGKGLATVELKEQVRVDYNAELARKMDATVWMNGGCSSWYQDSRGRNTTLWPDFTFRFREMTKTFDLESYDATPAGTAARTEHKETVA